MSDSNDKYHQSHSQTRQIFVALQPKYAYLTHFNRIEFTSQSADMLIQHIDGFVEIAKTLENQSNRHKAIKQQLLAYLLEIATNHGVILDEAQQVKLFKGDLEICA